MSDEVVIYKIEASRVNVKVGEQVNPETAIGEDFETGEKVNAGVFGMVESALLDGADHALNVVIRINDELSAEEEHDNAADEVFEEEDQDDLDDEDMEDDLTADDLEEEAESEA